MLTKITTTGATLLLLALGSAAHAQTTAVVNPEEAAAPTKVEPGDAAGVAEKDRIICRSVRHTGSRFPTRVCETKGASEKRGEEMRRQAEKINEKTKNTLTRKALNF